MVFCRDIKQIKALDYYKFTKMLELLGVKFDFSDKANVYYGIVFIDDNFNEYIAKFHYITGKLLTIDEI